MKTQHLKEVILSIILALYAYPLNAGWFDSNKSDFSGTWEDTSGMNIRIEVKSNNLLIIHVPQPRSDGQGMTGMDFTIRGSFSPSGSPTTILEQGVSHKCKLENGVLIIDGLPIEGRTFKYIKR